MKAFARTGPDSGTSPETTGEPADRALPCQTDPPYHILVADDEVSVRRLNTKILIDAGYGVDAAEDGAAAWDMLQLDSYDLLITDNHMPKLSGIELIEKVRAAGMALPVIMATGTSEEEQFAQYPRLQLAATLLKPYTTMSFLQTVRKVLP